jgi:hypothetical protein
VTIVGDVIVGALGTSTFQGPVGGAGRLVVLGAQSGTVVLANSGNSFTGGVKMGDGAYPPGALVVAADNAIPGAPILDLPFNATLTATSGHTQALAALTGNGSFNLQSASSSLVLSGSGEATFAGSIGAPGTITHTGSGRQSFTNANPIFAGSLHVPHGTVTIANGAMPAATDVTGDGRLSLMSNGGVGPLTLTGGRLLLSEGGAAIGRCGSLAMSAASTLEIGGSVPASVGRLAVTGAVALNGSALVLSLPEGFFPSISAAFTIIENHSGAPVTGTFAGLPEGATLTMRGTTFQISYAGGTGHDVVLTVTQVVREYFLSEGATGSFFTTELLLANPNSAPAPISITFLKEGGSTVVLNDTLGAMSHETVRVNDVAGMENTAFSTVVRSLNNLSIVVERTMSWDRTAYGSHTEHAMDGADLQWYFAEGSQGFFHTYLLLANPQATVSHATVQYLLEGSAPIVRQYQIAPTSRFTVDIGSEPALVGNSFGMIVTFDTPGMAERAMYFGDLPLWNGGHESAGVTAPSTDWFLAEGATGSFFETFLLLANPNPTDVMATLTYLPSTGVPVTVTRTIPANRRLTLDLQFEDPSLANAAVATRVSATLPIVVERSQYWPNPAPNWYEAHNSFGVTSLGTKWGLGEGRVGGSEHSQTYVLFGNPGNTAANVTITFLREAGTAPVTKTFVVQPTSRFNLTVGPGSSVPELANEHFGALISSDQPIAVERALYWDANGQIWAAGSNATATRLP